MRMFKFIQKSVISWVKPKASYDDGKISLVNLLRLIELTNIAVIWNYNIPGFLDGT